MEDILGLQDEFESCSKYFTDSFIMWTEPFTVNLFKSTFRIFWGEKKKKLKTKLEFKLKI